MVGWRGESRPALIDAKHQKKRQLSDLGAGGAGGGGGVAWRRGGVAWRRVQSPLNPIWPSGNWGLPYA